MKILNLGCGHKISNHTDVLNVDWSVRLRIKTNPVLAKIAPLVLDRDRLERLNRLPTNILAHDLSRGIPSTTNSVDVVFHSNVLEHLDREVAKEFLLEVLRVLRPGGIHRIVVPDFELACSRYLAHLHICEGNNAEADRHDDYIAPILEQSVRREAAGTQMQRPLRRWLENRLLGDARQRGETHQWMYDRISLKALLVRLGYRDIQSFRFDTSGIADWASYGLDIAADGTEYAPGSLYMEARK